MRTTGLLLLLILGLYSHGQDYAVSGVIAGLSGEMVYLADFRGDQHKVIDSTLTDLTGSFEIGLSGLETGFYRLIFARQKFIDFIFNGESVSFTTNVTDPVENIAFASSVENLIWYDYLFRKEESQYKLEILNPILIYYPKNNSFYTEARTEYKAVQDDFEAYVQSLLDLNTMTYAAKAIKVDKPYPVDIGLPLERQRDHIKKHYFDGISLADPSLLRSSIIASKIIGYLALYRDPSFSKEKQEEMFIQAVDTILLRVMDNEEVYDFTLRYLIDGFELYGFDQVITHIAEHYQPSEACIHATEKSELAKRMESIKKLAVGRQAPDIQFTDQAGDQVILSSTGTDYTLVVFWASWCSHCQRIMPELSGIYEENKGKRLEIIAIAVDTSYTAYQKSVSGGHYNWINYFDELGWDSKPAIDYSIYATPTMFLVDKELNIVAKPMDAYEIRKAMEKLP